VEAYIERDISKLEVGDVLIADGHVLNFQVINPFTGKPTRATLVGFLDWKSTALPFKLLFLFACPDKIAFKHYKFFPFIKKFLFKIFFINTTFFNILTMIAPSSHKGSLFRGNMSECVVKNFIQGVEFLVALC